jgi:hypothetical protein
MKLSELIELLQAIEKEQGGDIEVYNIETYRKANYVSTSELENFVNSDKEKIVLIG